MNWILFIVLVTGAKDGGITATSQTFASKDSCMVAGRLIENDVRQREQGHVMALVCAPQGDKK